MTNDEIKEALKNRLPIRHRDRVRQTAIIYAYAQAWRVFVDEHGRFVSALELVAGGNVPSVTIARADDCEIYEAGKL